MLTIQTTKPHKIYVETIEDEALKQFESAMNLDCVVQSALMPDAHTGYTLPIGGVVAVKDYIFPSFVGYDIGCGMCAYKTPYEKDQIEKNKFDLFNSIYRSIPTDKGHHNKRSERWDYQQFPMTAKMEKIFQQKNGLRQLCSLGGGNHFIEIDYDENDQIWIVIHSGSRGVGHATATYYMSLAKLYNEKKLIQDFETNYKDKIIQEYEKKHQRLKEKSEQDFYKVIEKQVQKAKDQFIEKNIGKSLEGFYGFHVESLEGKNYITDMNFCLEFALENRKRMIERVVKEINFYLKGDKNITIDYDSETSNGNFINRNHNHADFKDGVWIHRKGATHAEEGMLGVIPGNMRDGSFIVKGKGNPDSLFSSSHGAGRVLSRKKAKQNININDFVESMEGITAKVTEKTKDESPFAYKNIFEVIKLQQDLINVIHHLKPIVNIKG